MRRRTIPHLRWYIAILLCMSSVLTYLDRQTLSVLATTIQKELNLSTVQYSQITFAFLFSYTIFYAVNGVVIDWLGTRKGLPLFLSGWSVATMLHALASTVWQFSFFRVLLGATQPANFSAGVKAVSEWFPMKERALAVGIFNSGTAIGSAIATPIVAFIALELGWRQAFIVCGAIGFIWVIAWWALYRQPQSHRLLADDERELILSGARAEEQSAQTAVPLRRLLRMKETWGCIAARACTDPISYFLGFWIPKYLQDERGFTLVQIGFYAWIPYAALALGNIFSGAAPRYLVARGWTLNRARKTTMFVISCLMPVCCLLVTRVESAALAVALVTAMMFGHSGWGNITIPAEVFPKRVVGTVTGFGGAVGGLLGAISQLYIGYVVQHLSFAPIFIACSVMYLLGFAFVHFLAGELGKVRDLSENAA
ncbi:MAG: MFS transporter [Acidobacteria bacterium]|nr:MFS transporter [Acidobacteriota bacterium]